MAITINLPKPSPDYIYEGLDEDNFEDVTAVVTNRAPKQVQDNVAALRDAVVENLNLLADSIKAFGDPIIYSSESTYKEGRIVQKNETDRILYISQVNNNQGNSLDDTNFWKPLYFNIDDDLISTLSTWSSKKINSTITAKVLALG